MPSLLLLTREEFLEQLSATPVQCCAIIDEDTACAICMREPVDAIVNDDDENAVLLHETHSFGEKCAREWLSSSNTCPKCRTVLFEEEDDVDLQEEDAEMDDAAAEEMTFDEAEMAHLLWQAGQIMQRDPKTEAFDDREIMTVWFALWVQWQLALSDNKDYHTGRWATYGAASEEVSEALDELLRVRLRWYQHSPQQLNVFVTESFDYSVEEWWKPSERDLNKRVRIDFDCGMMSTLRAGLISGGFLQAFDGENACLNAAGHPLVIDIYSRLDRLLLSLEGVKLRVGSLRRKLHRELGDPDQLETRFDLPVGWPDFVRFVIDETCMMAVRRYDVHREAGAARAAAAARLDARRAARDAAGDASLAPTTPVSTCPRMSAPSTRTRE